jgi:hypothetical protein
MTTSLLASYESMNEDKKDILLLFGLCAALYGHSACSYTENNKKVRYNFTVEDCQGAFLTFVPTPSVIEETFNKKIDAYYKLGLTIQPFIYTVGTSIVNCSEYFVFMDNMSYKFTTFFDAIFCLVRIYFVFNLNFPKYCAKVFEFLQHFFFDIHTDYDQNYPEVKNIINQIKGFSDA